MGQDVLGALHEAVSRLLLVGGPAASGDDELARLSGPIHDLADRAPALAPLRASLDKLRGASGRSASEALLELLVVLGRVRAAQARLAPIDEAASPLPSPSPLPSEADAEEVERLRAALRQPGGARSALAQVFDTKRMLDLRLVGPWLEALADDASWNHILREIIPRLGDRAALWLSPAYDERGEKVDGRRLEALCAALGPERARPVIERALERGSPWVRASALRALAAIDPAAAEPFAVEALSSASHLPALREAGAQALSTSGSDRALELLVWAMLDDDTQVSMAASAALRTSRHPRIGERLASLLTPEALSIPIQRQTGWPLPGHEARVAKLGQIISALAGHLDEASGARLVEIARSHRLQFLRESAMNAVLEGGPASSLVALVQQLSATQPYQPLLTALVETAKRGEGRAVPALIAMLDRIDKSDRYLVYHALIALGDRQVLEPLRRRAKQKVLDERERALLDDAVTKLEGRGRLIDHSLSLSFSFGISLSLSFSLS